MWTILSRWIADFYKRLERKPAPDQLPEERDDEDGKAPDAATSKDDKGIVETQDATDRCSPTTPTTIAGWSSSNASTGTRRRRRPTA